MVIVALLNLLLILFVGISQNRVKTLLETLEKSTYLRMWPEIEVYLDCLCFTQSWNPLLNFNDV